MRARVVVSGIKCPSPMLYCYQYVTVTLHKYISSQQYRVY
jgi:hypothetical protein